MDAKTLEAWMRMTADALKGADQAQKALEALGKGPLSPEGVAGWWSAWVPKAETAPEGVDPLQFQTLVEQWWKAIGVVPRHRYLELLERYEQLRGRLEAAEETVKSLRGLFRAHRSEQEVGAALDQWEDVTRKALETQEEWMRTWMEGGGKEKDDKKR